MLTASWEVTVEADGSIIVRTDEDAPARTTLAEAYRTGTVIQPWAAPAVVLLGGRLLLDELDVLESSDTEHAGHPAVELSGRPRHRPPAASFLFDLAPVGDRYVVSLSRPDDLVLALAVSLGGETLYRFAVDTLAIYKAPWDQTSHDNVS